RGVGDRDRVGDRGAGGTLVHVVGGSGLGDRDRRVDVGHGDRGVIGAGGLGALVVGDLGGGRVGLGVPGVARDRLGERAAVGGAGGDGPAGGAVPEAVQVAVDVVGELIQGDWVSRHRGVGHVDGEGDLVTGLGD